ncbi:hypothetical protein BDF14DRAFT_1738609 [Spinellus fusiger]|nr:hypothetical protein BDF14DRAFT_1738609 [Spinellus fusiger]
MGIIIVVQGMEKEEKSKLTVTLVTITSVCFAFFGVPVGPLVDGGVLKILGPNKDQYGRNIPMHICNTQFKPEKIAPNHLKMTRAQVEDSDSLLMLSSASTSTVPSQQRQHYDAYEDNYSDTHLPQVRENEIQRLIQFATESSIIEAVNLSNPPLHRRRSSVHVAGADTSSIAVPTTIIELLTQPPVFSFFLTMMLMGASLNMVVSFLFIFLKQDLGASSSILIRHFGIKSLIILGHVLTIVRIFSYTLLPKGPTGATIALGLHLLNGIAFSALWGAGVVQADELAPPSLQATSQGKSIHKRVFMFTKKQVNRSTSSHVCWCGRWAW